jgi:hypothetical protein
VEIVLECVDLGVQPPKLSIVSVGRSAHVQIRDAAIQASSRTVASTRTTARAVQARRWLSL